MRIIVIQHSRNANEADIWHRISYWSHVGHIASMGMVIEDASILFVRLRFPNSFPRPSPLSIQLPNNSQRRPFPPRTMICSPILNVALSTVKSLKNFKLLVGDGSTNKDNIIPLRITICIHSSLCNLTQLNSTQCEVKLYYSV